MKGQKVTFIFLMVVLFTSCGIQLSTRQYHTSHPTFSPYVAEYERQGRHYLDNPNFEAAHIPINFGYPRNPEHDGVCRTYADGTREILIRRNWWIHARKESRQVLVFHELAHCILDKEHDNTLIGNRPASMMNEYIPTAAQYVKHKEEYHRELFTLPVKALSSPRSVGAKTCKHKH